MTTSTSAEQPAVPVQPETSAPPKPRQLLPQELAQQILGVLPELSPVRPDMETVFVCYLQYIGSPDNPVLSTDAATALEELSLLRGWDADKVRSSTANVGHALVETWAKLTEAFDSEANDTTPDRKSGLTLEEIRTRLQLEHTEQEELTKRSSQLLERVSAVRLKLALPQTPAVTSQTSAGESRPSGLAHALRGLGNLLIAPPGEDLAETEAKGPVEVPGWRTAPVWTPEDPEIKKFELVAKRAIASEDAELVWQTLQGFGLQRLEIQALVDHAAEMAQKQIIQSQQVMQNATHSQGEFGEHVESIMRLGDIVKSVLNFFFPQGNLGAKTAQ